MTDHQQLSLTERYAQIEYDFPPMQKFMGCVYGEITERAGEARELSILDIGCGRGYFLKYLDERGYKNVAGIEPSDNLRAIAVSPRVMAGSFEENGFRDNEFDIVYTCHTLHHLPDPWPVGAIREMMRIAAKYVLIVEINNTNIPMFFRSLLLIQQEVNAYRYNRGRVLRMAGELGIKDIRSKNIECGYLSGDGALYRALALAGTLPYNITVIGKTGQSQVAI